MDAEVLFKEPEWEVVLPPDEVMIAALKDQGYVVLKRESYRRAQERQRVAEALKQCEIEAAEHARKWAVNCLDEQRRLADRLTHVYGVARAHGATVEELRQP